MDGKVFARVGAVAFVAVAITATAIELNRKDDPAASPASRIVQPERDPLREEQRRCQQLGQKAADEAACLRVWAETRDRFLGRASSAFSGEGR